MTSNTKKLTTAMMKALTNVATVGRCDSRNTGTAKALEARGLIASYVTDQGFTRYTITDAGRAVLTPVAAPQPATLEVDAADVQPGDVLPYDFHAGFQHSVTVVAVRPYDAALDGKLFGSWGAPREGTVVVDGRTVSITPDRCACTLWGPVTVRRWQ